MPTGIQAAAAPTARSHDMCSMHTLVSLLLPLKVAPAGLLSEPRSSLPPLPSHPLLAGVAFIVRCTSLVLSQLVFYFGISEFGFISLRFLFIFRRSQVQQFSQSPLGEVGRGSQSREDSWSMWIMWIIVDRRLLPSTMHGKARRSKGAKSRGDLPKLFASLWYLKTRDG